MSAFPIVVVVPAVSSYALMSLDLLAMAVLDPIKTRSYLLKMGQSRVLVSIPRKTVS